MTEHPSVSVVVPVYNDAAALRRCLEALAAQDYPADRVQVVVVDNASDEDISHAIPDDPRFLVLHESRRGSYAARNTGVESATGEILAFTDSDCQPRSNWLSMGVRALLTEPYPDAVGGAITIFFPHSPEPRSGPEHFEARNEFQQRKYIERWSFAATANVFVSRAVFDRVGPFNPELKSGGDADWGNRLVAGGGRLHFCEKAVVDHPARSSWRELGRKTIRVANGIADRTAGRKARFQRGVREARAGLSIWVRVWDASGGNPADACGKIRYAAAFSYVRALRVGVHARRLVDGR